ncbi:DUF5335 family protein [Blastococcus sp. TML/M2B]|uniref:DUF5335 family protein n=1 Tax=unclassified Blastococcus TaxID=2619396 RepID=UPI0019099423|nr:MULTISPECIES: DUF5335 family protein [unclassified Blastococcus]MBN1092815.1 DUF5335 family protein [Blastococcus sp. TML/M2B]MBN1097078.1 DUF5335 family protein [Blastococcus sp. TML/C7B]
MSETTVEQRADWGTLTERLSAASAGNEVTIEILDAEGGDASMVERLPFSGITYDHKDDVLVVSVGGSEPRFPVQLRHVIEHPTEIQFDVVRQGGALKVTDASGTTTLISILRRSDRGDHGSSQP